MTLLFPLPTLPAPWGVDSVFTNNRPVFSRNNNRLPQRRASPRDSQQQSKALRWIRFYLKTEMAGGGVINTTWYLQSAHLRFPRVALELWARAPQTDKPLMFGNPALYILVEAWANYDMQPVKLFIQLAELEEMMLIVCKSYNSCIVSILSLF